jgi:hypothetical protein
MTMNESWLIEWLRKRREDKQEKHQTIQSSIQSNLTNKQTNKQNKQKSIENNRTEQKRTEAKEKLLKSQQINQTIHLIELNWIELRSEVELNNQKVILKYETKRNQSIESNLSIVSSFFVFDICWVEKNTNKHKQHKSEITFESPKQKTNKQTNKQTFEWLNERTNERVGWLVG